MVPPRNEPCDVLAWDSKFFSLAIGRVREKQLTESSLVDVLDWAKRKQIDCLYYLADSHNPDSCQRAEVAGFRFVDIRTTLEWTGTSMESRPSHVRLARTTDEEKLVSIARTAHTDSRFFADERFPRRDCERLFETWISRSMQGWAKAVLVADPYGPSGYLTCHVNDSGEGSIGLIAVAKHARGCGIGASLISASLDWFREAKIEKINVVTQGRNIGAQRLYHRAGFAIKSNEIWFHRWSQ